MCLALLAGGIVGIRLLRPAPAAPHRPSPLPAATAAVPALRPTVDDLVGRLDADRMKAHVHALADGIGVRAAGTAAEQAAAAYIAKQLAACGYAPTTVSVPLPNGTHSRNVIAELCGQSPRVLLIGAHLDSRPPSPGANDNASGVAVLLELARVLKDASPPCTLRFVAFGAEERQHRRGGHHYGSRMMAQDAGLRARLDGMVSLDMVGVGSVLRIDNQGWASDRWRDALSVTAKRMGLPARAGRSRPVSDHEAFERRGIPAAYLHWERDPAYHRRSDRPANVQKALLRQTAEVVVRAVLTGAEPAPYPTAEKPVQ